MASGHSAEGGRRPLPKSQQITLNEVADRGKILNVAPNRSSFILHASRDRTPDFCPYFHQQWEHTMKIAYIFDQVMPSIVTESMQPINTLSALAKQGCDCTLFIPASNCDDMPTPESLRKYYNVDGEFKIDLIHSIYPGPRMPQKVIHPMICATLLRKKLATFDVVYSRNIPAIMACLMSRIPALYDTYRPWPEQYQALIPLFRLMFASKYFLGMTLHSEYARQCYIDHGFDPERLCTAHNGYEKSHYEPVLSKHEAREMLGLPLDAKIAAYAGRFDMKKGLDHLLMLAKARPDVTFLFIGGGYDLDVKSEFEIEAAKLSNCIITGWKKYNEIPQYLYASDIVMIPPSASPLKKAGHTVLPLKLYSYIASGRAIYAPQAPDTAELLHHNQNAWLVPPDNFDEELKGFSELIDNPELLERLGNAAAEDAKNLTWDARAKTICAFVKSRKQVMGF